MPSDSFKQWYYTRLHKRTIFVTRLSSRRCYTAKRESAKQDYVCEGLIPQ